jgi:transcriptional regulator with XRE-family HTH domain
VPPPISHRSGSVDRIASAVRPKRRKLGLTTRQLGELAGVSHTTVIEVERGSERISPPTITKLVLALMAYDDAGPRALVQPRRSVLAFTNGDPS